MKQKYLIILPFLFIFSTWLLPSNAQKGNTTSNYTYTNNHTNGNGGGPGTGNGATNIHEPKNPNGAGFFHDKSDNGIGNDHQDEGICKNFITVPIDGGITMALLASVGFGIMKAREDRKRRLSPSNN